MDRVRIRRFDPGDVEELIPMWRESFEHGVGIIDPHPREAQTAYFYKIVVLEDSVRIAMDGNHIVAFMASNSESVAQLHVRVGYIGKGIGSRLLSLAKDESAGSLWLYTFAQNSNARRFYERHGFVAVQHGYEPTWKLKDVKYQWARAPSAV